MLMVAMAALLAAVSVQQSADASVAARSAFGKCLRAYLDASTQDAITSEAYQEGMATQCQEQERAMREAIRVRETAYGTPAEMMQEIADEEVADLRDNFRELYQVREAEEAS